MVGAAGAQLGGRHAVAPICCAGRRIPSPVAVGLIKCLIHKPLQVALACQRSTRLQIRDILCSVNPLIIKASTQLLKFPANELNPCVSTSCRYLRHAFHILIHSNCGLCRKFKPDPAISSKDYNCSKDFKTSHLQPKVRPGHRHRITTHFGVTAFTSRSLRRVSRLPSPSASTK